MVKRRLERDDLYRLRIAGDAQVAPDGRTVAYVVKRMDRQKDTYLSSIYVWADGAMRPYTSGEKDSCPRWSPDGRWLAFLSDRGAQAQIYVMPTCGGEAICCTRQECGAGPPVWSPDARLIAFAGPVPFGDDTDGQDARDAPQGARGKDEKPAKTKIIDRAVYKSDGAGFTHDRRTHLFVIPVSERGADDTESVGSVAVHQLTEGDCNDEWPAWSPDGRHIAFSGNRDADWDIRPGSDIWIVPAEGGEPRRLTGHDGLWERPVFSPDGSTIAYLGQPVPEGTWPGPYPQLWTIDRDGHNATNRLAEGDMEVRHSIGSDCSISGGSGLAWLRDGVYFLTSQHGASQIYRWHNGAVHAVTEGRHDVMDFSAVEGPDGTVTLLYTVSDTTHPTEVMLWRAGATLRVSHENDAWLDEVALGMPTQVIVTGTDDEEVEGWVLTPAGYQEGQRYPLLLYIHGGPATAYGESFFHELQWWAAQGYGVAYCNPHGSSTYGRHFQEVIRRDWGNRDYRDVMTFTDHIAALPWVDAHRLAAAGGSYGGFMVNWLAGHTARFVALCTQRSICNQVSQSGTSDLAPFRRHSEDGTPEGNPELLWNQSPLKYVRNVRTPMLILHQEQDHRCPIEQGEQWFSALKRQGVPVRFVRFPEESHGLSRTGTPSRRYARLGYMRDWFRQYV